MNRDWALSAILSKGRIAMVKVVEENRSFWTLPGGGVEMGESHAEAAVREAREEINLAIKILRFLFKREYAAGMEYCYLAEPRYGEQGISIGHDPELDVNQQVLKQAAWVHIEKVKDDLHVSRVIASLSQEEMEKFKINLRDAKV